MKMDYLVVGIGGFLGAISRFGIYQLEKKFFLAQFPWATFFVNCVGCLLAGLALGYFQKSTFSHQANLSLFLIMGFIGSFTTFSTLGVESFKLISSENWIILFSSLIANIGVGIFCVFLGTLLISKNFSLP